MFDSRRELFQKFPTITDSARKRHHKQSSEKGEVEEEQAWGTKSFGSKIDTDPGTKLVSSTGNADLFHLNLMPLAFSDKFVLEDEDSLVGYPHISCFGDLVNSHGSNIVDEFRVHAKHSFGNQSVKSQEEPKKLNVSSISFSANLGDFMPLTSPDHFELANVEAPILKARLFVNI